MGELDLEPNALIPSDSIACRKGFFTVAEFRDATGLSESTIRRLIRDKRLPVLQPGGYRCRILIPHATLELVKRLESAREPGLGLSPPITEIPGPKPRWQLESKPGLWPIEEKQHAQKIQ